ncbi:LysR family transcriptional regulator [Pseudoalteromonas sp. R3]|uniref:LysR family transcriptional regulator n=1 Tax=Pseudoalteromonas sp. R3 TaxID=1709477 RepID=UPI0006B443CD|nr:LysR family transcriptional regulator [Pseudoalteromonas sp. R3]AZZ96508.1 LysR family transcriptional regulator [Pseudoalteromonas sp. R3]
MDWLTATRSFCVLAELGSFTKAAQHQGVSASAMSKRIDWLEKHLGQSLFIRTTRQVNLTEQGQNFFPRARDWLAQFEALVESTQSEPCELQGSLKIAATQAVGSSVLMPKIELFLAQYPQITIHLNVLAPGEPPDLQHDVVITRYNESFDSVSHKGTRLFDYQMQLFGAPEYLARCDEIASVDDLAQHKMLLSSYYHKVGGVVLEDGRLFEFTNYNFVTDHLDAILKAAVQGIGLLFIAPSYIERELSSGALVPILPDIRSEVKQLWAYYPKASYTPRKTRLFIEHLKTTL